MKLRVVQIIFEILLVPNTGKLTYVKSSQDPRVPDSRTDTLLLRSQNSHTKGIYDIYTLADQDQRSYPLLAKANSLDNSASDGQWSRAYVYDQVRPGLAVVYIKLHTCTWCSYTYHVLCSAWELLLYHR